MCVCVIHHFRSDFDVSERVIRALKLDDFNLVLDVEKDKKGGLPKT